VRFLFLTQYYPPEIGAPQTHLEAILRSLKAQGHDVEVVTALPNYPTGKVFPGYQKHWFVDERHDDVFVRRSWVYPAMGTGLRRLANYASFSASALLPLARSESPDVLFIESPPLPLAVTGFLGALRFRRRPWTVLEVADLWPDMPIEAGLMKNGALARTARFLERWAYRNLDFVSTVTHGMYQVLRDEKQVPEDRLLYLPSGVDTERFAPEGPPSPLAHELRLDEAPTFLYAGTTGEFQGLERVLDAAAVLQGRGHPARFVFVGDGSASTRLREHARALALNNVRFHPMIPAAEIPALYRHAYAGLVPLAAGPWNRYTRPSKILQVFAMGRPVLFVGEGETAALVESTKTGVTVRSGEAAAIAEAVESLVARPDTATEYGARGRQLALDEFRWDVLVARWIDDLARKARARNLSSAETRAVSLKSE
jgi:glycosyltransferase involved in cell wall biosynthesis